MNISLLRLLPLFAFIVSCTTQDVPPTSRSAQFVDYPQNLFSSFEVDCSGPGDDYAKVGNGSFECREILSPQTAAFLILNYEGSTQNLPKVVTRLSSTKNPQGYRVDADLFFLIPQRDGSSVKVPVEGDVLDRELSELYLGYGGTPL